MPYDEADLDTASTTFVAVGKIRDHDAFKAYAAKATPLLEAAGGSLVVRQPITDSLDGEDISGIVLTMRFGDATAIRRVFASAAYRALIPTRDQAFDRLDLWIGPGE